MNDIILNNAYRRAVVLHATQKKMQRLLNWQGIAIKGHARWVKAMNRVHLFDEDILTGELWTITETREGLLQKAIGHFRAYLYALDKVEQYKSKL